MDFTKTILKGVKAWANSNFVNYNEQTLTDNQKAQVRENIGLVDPSGSFQELVTNEAGEQIWGERTHYEYTAEIVPETSFSAEDIIEGLEGFPIKTLFELVDGKDYVVTYNGTDYRATAQKIIQTEDLSAFYLGNIGFLSGEESDDNGLPFLFALPVNEDLVEGVYGLFLPLDQLNVDPSQIKGTYSIKGLVAKKLDPKFYNTPDWNAQEGEAGYIKNKTHGLGEYVEYFPETEAQLEEAGGVFVFQTEKPMSAVSWIEPDKFYTITYNGVDYNCKFTMEDSIVYTGNASIIDGPASDEPFFMLGQPVDSETVVIVFAALDQTEATTITLKISNELNRIQKLDNKYLDLDQLPTDTTLSKSGAFADAKVTGEKILEAETRANTYTDEASYLTYVEGQRGMPQAPDLTTLFTYGNGKFISIYYGTNKAAYSEDGIYWTEVALPSEITVTQLLYANDKFIACGHDAYFQSEDGIVWNDFSATSPPHVGFVVYGNGKFISTGYSPNENVAYSEDGINWINGTAPLEYNKGRVDSLIGMAYGNGKFVMAINKEMYEYNTESGEDDLISTVISFSCSEDGLSWTETEVLTGFIKGFAYGNGKFIAVCRTDEHTKVLSSEDGINWEITPAPLFMDSYMSHNLIYAGKFIIPYNSRFCYSENGITWYISEFPCNFSTNSIIVYGDGKYICMDTSSNNMVYSKDGIHWEFKKGFYQQKSEVPLKDYIDERIEKNAIQKVTHSMQLNETKMIYANDKFVSASQYSEDGINWIESIYPIEGDRLSSKIVYGNNKFVSISRFGYVAWSDDGINWDARKMLYVVNNFGFYPYDIAYGNGKFVVICSNESNSAPAFLIIYSEDGVNWTKINNHIDDTNLLRILYCNGKFVISGGLDSILYSENGVDWTVINQDAPFDLLAASDSVFMATKGNRILSSEDGVNWVDKASLMGFGSQHLYAYVKDRFVYMPPFSAYMYYSVDDGATWTSAPIPVGADAWECVVYGNGKFIAVGKSGLLTFFIYSYDGITWYDDYTGFYQNGEEIDIATKTYVDTMISGKLNESGWSPNSVLTTDGQGNVVATKIGEGGSPLEEQLLYSGSFTNLVASAHNEVTLNFNLTAGANYSVYVNGTKYAVTCENLEIHAMLALGNKHIIQDTQTDTGEPFFIYERNGETDAGKQYIMVGAPGNYEISIYTLVPTSGSTSSSCGASLAGKKILILGDSVNAGNGWEGGFANLINEEFKGVTINNSSVSGAKLAEKEIYGQLLVAFQNGFIPDYIIFDGGGNDILSDVATGSVDIDTYSVGGYGNEFDTNTIAGAFENLVTNMQKFMPNAKIIFFNLYKMHPTTTEITYTKQRQVWNLLRECCEKYSIRYVDLWGEGNFTPNSTEQWNAFMYDWIHINEAGYRRFWPLIRKILLEEASSIATLPIAEEADF